jgi:hypothetical protein
MNNSARKNRFTFRPALGGSSLEERVVLNGSQPAQVVAAAHQVTPLQTQAGAATLTLQQIRSAYGQQFRAAIQQLRASINAQVAQLYANGQRPTAAQLAAFNANVAGALDATALRLSSQYSLLPGTTSRLVANLQNSLLGSQRTSLASQITNLANSSRFNGSQTVLNNAINQRFNSVFTTNANQLANFFNTTPINRLSVDATTGQRIPFGQFLANQAISQFNNTFGSLVNSVPNAAQTALFANGGNPTTTAVNGFQQQFSNALGTAAFQLGSALSLFPNATTTLAPQLNSALFSTGTNPATGQPFNSVLNGFQGLFNTNTTTPLTANTFNTGFQNAFTNSFQGLASPIFNTLGVQPTLGSNGNIALPNGFFQNNATFTNPFNSQFTGNNFFNGFNNGFVTGSNGFPGFGQAPSAFNNNFSTGFNNFTSTLNQQFGFTQPTLGTGTTTGTIGGTTPTVPTGTATITTGGGTINPGGGVFLGTGTTGTSGSTGTGSGGTGVV